MVPLGRSVVAPFTRRVPKRSKSFTESSQAANLALTTPVGLRCVDWCAANCIASCRAYLRATLVSVVASQSTSCFHTATRLERWSVCVVFITAVLAPRSKTRCIKDEVVTGDVSDASPAPDASRGSTRECKVLCIGKRC